MTEPHFSNAQELIGAFNIPGDGAYTSITPLNDRKVGFSVQRQYPDGLLYVPLKNRKGDDDTVALIHVVYAHPSESEEFDSHKVPLIVRVTTHSKYLSNHVDFNFEDKDSPTEESIKITKSTPLPLAIDYYDDYFYDHHTSNFLDSTLNPIEGVNILDNIFVAHCNTAHERKGRRVRRKIELQNRTVDLLQLGVSGLKWALVKLFGRTLDESGNYFAYLDGYDKASLKKLSTESISERDHIILLHLVFSIWMHISIRDYYTLS